MQDTVRPIGRGAIVAMALPAVPMYALMVPLAIFLPAYYADSLGVGMAAVGSVFALGRVFDVVTDPFAGVLMDRLQHAFQRKYWLAVGALPIVISVWNLFFVQNAISTTELFLWLLCLYVGWTFMSVGLFSWAAETSYDYNERSRVMAAIQAGNSFGSVMVLLLPVAIEWVAPQGTVSGMRVQSMGAFILITLPITIFLALRFGPPSVVQARSQTALGVMEGIKIAAGNGPLRRLLLADFVLGLNLGIGTSVSVFFVEIVLGHGGRAGTVQLFTLLAGLACIPLWLSWAKRLEKHRAFSIAAFVSVVGGVFALLVPPDYFLLYFIGSVILGMNLGGIQFLPRAIMADVLDHDRMESKAERAGLYYAFLTTTLKVGLAAGIALSFYLAAWGGFDPALARETGQGAEVVRYITGVSSIVLALTCILAMWRFPLGRAAQASLAKSIREA